MTYFYIILSTSRPSHVIFMSILRHSHASIQMFYGVKKVPINHIYQAKKIIFILYHTKDLVNKYYMI